MREDGGCRDLPLENVLSERGSVHTTFQSCDTWYAYIATNACCSATVLWLPHLNWEVQVITMLLVFYNVQCTGTFLKAAYSEKSHGVACPFLCAYSVLLAHWQVPFKCV